MAGNTDDYELSKELLSEYMSSLNSAFDVSSDLSAEEVKAAFAADGEAVDVDDEDEPSVDLEIQSMLSAPEPTLPGDASLDTSLVCSTPAGSRIQ